MHNAMPHISPRHLQNGRDLLIAGGIFAWALLQTPDATFPKTSVPVAGKVKQSSAVEDAPPALVRASEKKLEATHVRQEGPKVKSLPTRRISAPATSFEDPPSIIGIEHPAAAHEPAGNVDVDPTRAVRESSAHSAIPHRANARLAGQAISASVPQEPVKSPVAFAILESQAELGSFEGEVIYRAQQSFADEMKSSPVTDPASPEYAAHWKRAVEAHDDYLRRTLGWDKFNQLSALAGRRSHEESLR